MVAATAGPVTCHYNAIGITSGIDPQRPISLNAVMVALVDHSARPIWSAADKKPKTDADWGEIEYHASQIMIAGTVINIPGTGPADAGWVVQPEWLAFSKQLTDEGPARRHGSKAGECRFSPLDGGLPGSGGTSHGCYQAIIDQALAC